MYPEFLNPFDLRVQSPAWLRVELSVTFFITLSVDRDVKPLVQSLNILSGDLKEPTHFSIRVGLYWCCGLSVEGAL